MSFEYVRGEYWLDFRSRVAPTVSGFCRHHDRRRQWKCCSILLCTKHLTEKSNLPYKPDSSRGGSRAIQTGHHASEVAHMDLAGIQRLTCSLPAVSRLHSFTHNSIPTIRPSSFRLKGWSVSDRRKIERVSDSTLARAVPAPALTTSPERAEKPRPS